jgi:hypothetical protein
MTVPRSTWPASPAAPPGAATAPRTPWLPEPRPTAPGPVSASAALVVGAGTGWPSGCSSSGWSPSPATWTPTIVNRTVAELALLDATGGRTGPPAVVRRERRPGRRADAGGRPRPHGAPVHARAWAC